MTLDLWIDYFQDLGHQLWKYVVHLWTGKCEIQRICGNKDRMHSASMTEEFARSLKKSRQLVKYSKIVFRWEAVPIHSFTTGIMQAKGISIENSLLLANIRTCLQHVHMINMAIQHLQKLKSTIYSDNDPEHVALLESLWRNLKPHVTRQGGRITAEWGEVGFQGRDPATDFRGMGLLGLIQLVYFSEKMPELAISLLSQSQYDHQYFPYAATGINVTAVVVDMTLLGCFHHNILEEIDKIILHDSSQNIEREVDQKTIQAILNIIHAKYCVLFLRLGKTWLDSNSKDLMAFPKVFKGFKEDVLALYPKL
ncbi:hypothetical protein EON65_14650 [archaeon]|nr:MAG: hypothetical protein EON65_14650 [archaeon]